MKNNKNILLCSVPDGPLESTMKPRDPEALLAGGETFKPAFGLARILDWMNENGYKDCWNFYDINNLRPNDEMLYQNFKKFNPTIVGLSGTLSHCYPNLKRISHILREMFPEVWIVVGGHSTASAQVILEKTEADICIIGDGEISWIKLLDCLILSKTNKHWNYSELEKIQGLAFLNGNNLFKLTGFGQQIPESEMKFPDYEILKKGFLDKPEWVKYFFQPAKDNFIVKQSKYYNPNSTGTISVITTSKGCVARCTFCQRYTKGYRAHDVEELESYIMELKEKFNVEGFLLEDENFGSNKEQAYGVARIMKKCDVYWMVLGIRPKGHNIKYENLKFYKDHNLIYMKYGIESGSTKILEMMEKKYTPDDILEGITNLAKLDLICEPDALMLGMPGETEQTVKDSSRFIALLRYTLGYDYNIGSPFWATAFPGTPLYEFCLQIGAIGKTIEEQEEYLYMISREKCSLFNYINKTESSILDLFYWEKLFNLEGKKEYVRLLRTSNTNLWQFSRLIYQRCIQSEINNMIIRYKKDKNLVATILGMIFFTLNIFNLFLPRKILYPVVRLYTNISYLKNRIGRENLGLFIKQNKLKKSFLISDEKLSKSKKIIQRSLRKIVAENRKTISNKPLTEIESYQELLSKGL